MSARLDGFGVLEKIGEAAARPPRIRIVSASIPSILARLPPVDAVLAKPFDVAALIAAARAVVAGKPGSSD